jgi:ATP-dependent DNA ligase
MPLAQTQTGLSEIAFLEWTDAGHLRHCTFVGLRDDKKPAEVVRET